MKVELGKKYKTACGFMVVIDGFDHDHISYQGRMLSTIEPKGWFAGVWSEDGQPANEQPQYKLIGEWPGP